MLLCSIAWRTWLQAPLQLGDVRQSLIDWLALQLSSKQDKGDSLFEGVEVLLEAGGYFAGSLLTRGELIGCILHQYSPDHYVKRKVYRERSPSLESQISSSRP